MNNGVLAQVHLTLGPMNSQIHPVAISPVLGCIIGIDRLSKWQDPHVGSQTCGVRDLDERSGERCAKGRVWEDESGGGAL